MDSQYIILAIITSFIVILVPVIFLFFKLYVRKTNLSIEKQRIELEVFRKSLENNIYNTTDKIASNTDRWKDVNHLIFDAAQKSLSESSKVKNQFLDSLSIRSQDILIDHNKAFLLAPINERFSEKVSIVKEACNEIGINCETADEEYISGPILTVIVKNILEANLIIAIIDGRNPNVFYELGLAHALGKTVVMISNGDDSIPFDIKSQRMVIVDWSSFSTVDKLRKAIAESMRWASL